MILILQQWTEKSIFMTTKQLKNCVASQDTATYTASQGEVGLSLQGNDIKPKWLGDDEHSNENASCSNNKDNELQYFNFSKIMKIFKIIKANRQIVEAYDDGEVISIHRYLTLATCGSYKGGNEFTVLLSDEDALKHFKQGGFVMADITAGKETFRGLKTYTVNKIVPLEKSAVVNCSQGKAPWEYSDDNFNKFKQNETGKRIKQKY